MAEASTTSKAPELHESGWDAATSAEERPFGWASRSACMPPRAASSPQTVSGSISTPAAALAKASIEVEPITEAVAGTGSSCTALTCPTWAIASRACAWVFRWTCCSASPLIRRFAAAHLATMASPMGTVHLTGTRDGKFSYKH